MPITSSVIIVTPEDAKRFLGNMIHNRPVSAACVKKYADAITAGNWALNGQGIIFDTKGRLLDGQHRMHAVIKAGRSIKIMATHGVSEDMFCLMDIGNKRTVSDVIDVKNRNVVAAAAKYVYRESIGLAWSGEAALSPMNGVEIVNEHPGLIESASAICGMSGIKGLMAPGNATYCHYRAGRHSVKRDEFFDGFNTGANLGPRSPILALRNALSQSRGTFIQGKYQVSMFIIAWKVYVAGGQLKIIRVPKDLPEWEIK